MSNISRRDFLKTAGVMTLAVAAAGVLAGCEGNKPTEETPVVTKNSVTVGDYTFTIKDSKVLSYKTWKGDNTSETNKLDNEDRYVVVLAYLKNNKNSTKAPNFGMTVKHDNVDTINKWVYAAGVKKLFNLPVMPSEFTEANGLGGKAVQNATAEGTPYFFACKIDTYTDKTFKTPSISFVANDANEQVYTKLDVVIPATVENVTAKQLQGKE